MDILSNLKYAASSRKKRKRVGRGEGSGHGGTATKGMNGQLSRSGAKHRAWFEGGQMPLQRRVPKFGFVNIFKVYFQVVKISDLQKLVDEKKVADEVITGELLHKFGVIDSVKKPYKVLANGELKAKINIETNAISEAAKQKIEACGGTVKIL